MQLIFKFKVLGVVDNQAIVQLEEPDGSYDVKTLRLGDEEYSIAVDVLIDDDINIEAFKKVRL